MGGSKHRASESCSSLVFVCTTFRLARTQLFANPQQILPLAKVALETHALRDLKA